MNAMILTADADVMAGLAILSGISLMILIPGAIAGILVLIARWKIFTKAGQKGWKSLIPVYGTYLEFAFTWSGLQGILTMACLFVAQLITGIANPDSLIYGLAAIPAIYAGVAALIQMHKLSQSFGHGFGFTLGLIFLNPIFMMILGFGKSEYVGPAMKAK